MVDPGVGPFQYGAADLGNHRRAIDDAQATAVVDAAWEVGVRVFDTAPHYGLGLSERRLGAGLRDRPRDAYAVSTKVGRVLEPVAEPTGDDLAAGFAVPAAARRVWDPSRDGIRRSLDDSLDRLGLDRVDVAYLHDPDEYEPEAALDSALPALARLRDEGVVSAVGVGSKSVDVLRSAVRRGGVDQLMVAGRYTLLEQPAARLLAECAEAGVRVIAVGVFNSGLLSRDRPTAELPYEYGTTPPELLERARRIAGICERHGVALPAAALAFPRRSPAVAAVAIGAQTPEQVRENAARAAVDIPEALWGDLAEAGLL